jgi:hypothetical protein
MHYLMIFNPEQKSGRYTMAATACPVIRGLDEDTGVEEPRAADGELVERGPRPGRAVG